MNEMTIAAGLACTLVLVLGSGGLAQDGSETATEPENARQARAQRLARTEGVDRAPPADHDLEARRALARHRRHAVRTPAGPCPDGSQLPTEDQLRASRLETSETGPVATASTYRAEFTGAGARFRPRGPDGATLTDGEVTFDLSSVTRGETVHFDAVSAPGSGPTVDGQTVAYERTETIREWYRVLDEGIEQGFTLDEVPGDQGDLVVSVRLTTSLEPHLEDGGLVFTRGGETLVEVSRAVAFDEAGHRVTLPLGLVDGQMELRVPNDWLAEAEGRVVVDPLIASNFAITTLAQDDEWTDLAYNSERRELVSVSINGGQTLTATLLDREGNVLNSGVVLDGTTHDKFFPAVAWSEAGVGNYLVAYERQNLVFYVVIDEDLNIVRSATRIFDPAGSGEIQLNPDTTYNPDRDQWAVTWDGDSQSTTVDILVDTIDTNGFQDSPANVIVEDALLGLLNPSVSYSEISQRYLFTYTAQTTDQDVWARVMSGDLSTVVASPVVAATLDAELDSESTWNSVDDEWLVGYERGPSSLVDTDIYAQRMGPGGSNLGSAIAVATGSLTLQAEPYPRHLEGSNSYLIAWEALPGGDWDTYIREYSSTGSALTSETLVSSSSEDARDPAIAATSTHHEWLVAWADFRSTTDFDVWGQRVESGNPTPPDPPVITSPPDGSTVADSTPLVEGTSEASAAIEVLVDGAATTPATTTTADGNGDWSVEIAETLSDGQYTLTATATNGQGTSAPSDPVEITVDAFTVTFDNADDFLLPPDRGGDVTTTISISDTTQTVTVRTTHQATFVLVDGGGSEVTELTGVSDGDTITMRGLQMGPGPTGDADLVAETSGGTEKARRETFTYRHRFTIDAQCPSRNCPSTNQCGHLPMLKSDGADLLISQGLYQPRFSVLPGTVGRNGLTPDWTLRYNSMASSLGGPFGRTPFTLHCFERLFENASGDVVYQEQQVREYTFDQASGTGHTADERYEVITDLGSELELRRRDGQKMFFHPLDGSFTAGALKRCETRFGDEIAFSYDARGRLTTITDMYSRTWTLSYDARSRLASITEESTELRGRTVDFSYDTDNRLTRIDTTPVNTDGGIGNTFPDGKDLVFTYPTWSGDYTLDTNISSVVYPNEVLDGSMIPRVQNTYGTSGTELDRITSQDWGGENDTLIEAGGTLSYVYDHSDPAAPTTTVTDRNGNDTLYTFDDCLCHAVRVEEFTNRGINPNDLSSYVTTVQYNADGLSGSTAQEVGRPVEVHRPTSELSNGFTHEIITNYRWNAFGQRIAEIDPEGYLDEYRYGDSSDPEAGTPSTSNGGYLLETVRDLDTAIRTPDVSATRTELTTTLERDDVGNVTARIDGRGIRHEYVVNERNQVQLSRQATSVADLHSSEPVTPEVLDYERETHYDANDNVVETRVENLVPSETSLVGGTTNNAEYVTQMDHDILDNPISRVQEVYEASESATILGVSFDIVVPSTQETIKQEMRYDRNENPVLTQSPLSEAGTEPNNVTASTFDERNLIFERSQGGLPSGWTTNGAHADIVLDAGIQHDTNLTAVFTTTYDGNRNVIERTDAEDNGSAGDDIAFTTYDGFDRQVLQTDPFGNERFTVYDPDSNVIERRAEGPDGGNKPGNDTNNVRLSETRSVFDEVSRVFQSETDFFRTPGGATEVTYIRETLYDRNSRAVQREDARGNVTQTDYDGADRAILTIDAAGNSVARTYDQNSNVVVVEETEVEAADGFDDVFVRETRYDAVNRPILIVDNIQNARRTFYDSRGNAVARTDANGSGTTTETMWQRGSISTNEDGNRVFSIVDGLGRNFRTRRELRVDHDGSNALDSPSFNTDGLIVTTTDFDDNSRVVSRTDDRTNTTSYAYDILNRRTQTDFADTTSRSVSYDRDSNVTQTTDQRGVVCDNTYDSIHRVTQKDYTLVSGVEGTTQQLFEYDGLSRVTRQTDNNGSGTGNDSEIVCTYDSLSRCLSDTQKLGSHPDADVDHEYDRESNLIQLSYPSNPGSTGRRKVTMGYDDLNRRNIVEEGAGSGSGNDIVPTTDNSDDIATYDFFGPWRLEERLFQPSMTSPVTTNFSYDDARRVTQLAHTNTGDGGGAQDLTFNYAYDREGRPLSEEAAHEGAGGDLYEYDSSYRLEQETREDTGATLPSNNQAGNPSPSGTLTDQSDWRLDGTSNWREVEDENDSTTTRSVNSVNEYTDVDTTVRSHDANGNLTDDGTNSYFYDALNRLVRVEDSGGATIGTYVWDAKGRMVRHIVTNSGNFNTDRRLVYGSGVLEEQDATGAADRQYVYGRGEMVQVRNSSGNDRYYLEKNGGSIVSVITAGGFIEAYYDYEAYGGVQAVNHIDEVFFNGDDTMEAIDSTDLGKLKHYFQGMRFTPETGLLVFDGSFLFYDKKHGRYITRDGGQWEKGELGNGYAKSQVDKDISDLLRAAGETPPWVTETEVGPNEFNDYEPTGQCWITVSCARVQAFYLGYVTGERHCCIDAERASGVKYRIEMRGRGEFMPDPIPRSVPPYLRRGSFLGNLISMGRTILAPFANLIASSSRRGLGSVMDYRIWVQPVPPVRPCARSGPGRPRFRVVKRSGYPVTCGDVDNVMRYALAYQDAHPAYRFSQNSNTFVSRTLHTNLLKIVPDRPDGPLGATGWSSEFHVLPTSGYDLSGWR